MKIFGGFSRLPGLFPQVSSAVALQGHSPPPAPHLGCFPALEGLSLKKKSWFVCTLRSFSSPDSTSRNVLEDTGSTKNVELLFLPPWSYSKAREKHSSRDFGVLCVTLWLFQVFPAWWQRKVTQVQPLVNKMLFGEPSLGTWEILAESGAQESWDVLEGHWALGVQPQAGSGHCSEPVPQLIRTNVISFIPLSEPPLVTFAVKQQRFSHHVGPVKLTTPNPSGTI